MGTTTYVPANKIRQDNLWKWNQYDMKYYIKNIMTFTAANYG